jgi:hypothetical protein
MSIPLKEHCRYSNELVSSPRSKWLLHRKSKLLSANGSALRHAAEAAELNRTLEVRKPRLVNSTVPT